MTMSPRPHRAREAPATSPHRDAEPPRDRQTVTAAGDSLAELPEGVSLRDITTHVDERGAVCELFDLRWGWRS
jgi:hypothetical protein